MIPMLSGVRFGPWVLVESGGAACSCPVRGLVLLCGVYAGITFAQLAFLHLAARLRL